MATIALASPDAWSNFSATFPFWIHQRFIIQNDHKPDLMIENMGQEKIVKEDANHRIVSYYSFSRETIVTDSDIGRSIKQIPRKIRPLPIIVNLLILTLLCLPAYLALTTENPDGTPSFSGGKYASYLPFASR